MEIKERKKLQRKWRERRMKSGLGIQQFADKYRFDLGQLSRFERGIGNTPTMTSCERMEAALLSEKV